MSASAMYKQYTKRSEANGKTPLDFDTWKARYLNRAPRGTRSNGNGKPAATAVVEQPQSNGNGQPTLEQIVAAVLAATGQQPQAVETPVETPAQPDAEVKTFEIRDPDSQATGRQLWKLMNLGLIDFISKGEASQLIDAASK